MLALFAFQEIRGNFIVCSQFPFIDLGDLIPTTHERPPNLPGDRPINLVISWDTKPTRVTAPNEDLLQAFPTLCHVNIKSLLS